MPGTGGIFFYQGNRTKTMTALYERYLGCAAFHPTNDNVVFIFGGRNEHGTRMDTAFKGHFFSCYERFYCSSLSKPNKLVQIFLFIKSLLLLQLRFSS